MNDLIKKLIYNTVGTVVVSNKKLKELIEELIQNNDYTQDEGKRVIHKAIVDTEDAVNSMESKINNIVNQVLTKLNLPNTLELKSNIENIKDHIKDFGFFSDSSQSKSSIVKK